MQWVLQVGLQERHGLDQSNFRTGKSSSEATGGQPIIKPRLAPENLPSVMRHVDLPSPAPIIAPVGPNFYVTRLSWLMNMLHSTQDPLTEHLLEFVRRTCIERGDMDLLRASQEHPWALDSGKLLPFLALSRRARAQDRSRLH